MPDLRAEPDTGRGRLDVSDFALPALPESAVPAELVERAAVAIRAEWDSINPDTRAQAGESFKRRVYAEAAFKTLFADETWMMRLAIDHYPPAQVDIYDCDACAVADDTCMFHRGINAVCAVIEKDEEGAKVLARLVPKE